MTLKELYDRLPPEKRALVDQAASIPESDEPPVGVTTNTDPRATNHEADELRQMLAEMDPKDAPAPPVLVDRLDRALSTERDLMVRQEDHLPCDRSDCSPLLCGHPVAR